MKSTLTKYPAIIAMIIKKLIGLAVGVIGLSLINF